MKVAPSILAADFARLGAQLAEAEKAGADRIHIDVMDGHFAPNLSMGAPVVASLRPVTRLPLETHLMISNPDPFLQEFADSGADSFLVHWEGNVNLHRTVQSVRALGKPVGVAINPATPGGGARRNSAGRRSGARDGRRPGFRAPAFSPFNSGQDQPCPADDRSREARV